MKPIVAFVSLVVGCAASAAAQDPAQFAYAQCAVNPDFGELDCAIETYLAGAGTTPHAGYAPHWSPDGSSVVYYDFNYTYVAVMSAATGAETVLTDFSHANMQPVWGRDGRIAFLSNRDGLWEFYAMNADGTHPARITTQAGVLGWFNSWALSPDASKIAFETQVNGAYQLWSINTDGTGLRYLTDQFANRPAWSADGRRLAFECVSPLRNDICVMDADGTNLQRLTGDPDNALNDTEPAFSPGGTLAFTTEMFGGGSEIALMDSAGAITRLAPGVGGTHAVWSPDGTRLLFSGTTPSYNTGICDGGDYDFCYSVYPIYVINADGSGLTHLADGENPDWRPSGWITRPAARFDGSCSGTACTFDATASVGAIASYAWQFGDASVGSGATASHTYAAGATYSVTLTVTDSAGRSDTLTKTFVANTPPVASFTESCSALTCTFNASASFDVDGSVVSYAWYFGDGQYASGKTVTHAFGAPWLTSATLTVTDNAGASSAPVLHSLQLDASIHVGDLDRVTASFQNSWSAMAWIAVHDAAHQPLASALVTAVWNDGTVQTCGTDASGRCAIGIPSMPKKIASVTLTIESVTRYGFTYKPSANHDPDGDSTGTKIVIAR